MVRFCRGSEWRRWELHIHTPGTLKNDQFVGSTLEEKWDRYYSDIKSYISDGSNIENNIAVIAITDYLSIDNYLKVKVDNKLPESVMLILPNVELRISPVSGTDTPINIHCIFSPKTDSQLENRFFGKLKFSYGNSSYSATRSELIRLGRAFMNNSTLNEVEARKVGAEQFVISYNDLKKLFDEDTDLREKTIIVVSNKSNDGASGLITHSDYFISDENGTRSQLQATRQSIYQMSCAIFSSNEKDMKYFSGSGADSQTEVIRKCGSLMPCFHGCDAHENSKIFNPEQNRFCWIKADPTFEGLKQVLNEPKDRVFIGRVPEIISRVNNNKTKYINELFIDTIEGKDDPTNIWFNSNHIPLNYELVAIIGNKGSGKSAISDIIGLCADSEHSEDFMFLNDEKFKKKGFAERFYSNIVFASGAKTENRILTHKIKTTDVPKIQYLPQHYFENVCNEIGKVEALRKEIEKVVFQYIPEEKKFKKGTFDELISFKKESIETEILNLRNQIETINKDIIALEDKKNPEYKKSIESKKAAKEEELRVHIGLKPQEKQNPTIEETPETQLQNECLVSWESKLKDSSDQIAVIESEISNDALAIEELKQLKRDIDSKAREIEYFLESKQGIASKYSLNIADIFNIKYDTSQIESLFKQKEIDNMNRKNSLGSSDLSEGADYEQLKLRAKVAFCHNEIGRIKVNLSQGEQEYQRYLEDLKKWEKKKAEIVGATDSVDTLEYYKNEIEYIDNNLMVELSSLRERRLSFSKMIFQKKVEIKTFYDEIKAEIDSKLCECQGQNLTIDSSFSLASDFIDTFMSYILKNKVGSFRGQEEGTNLFKERILNELDWNQEDSITLFLNNTIDYLENDRRDANTNAHKSTFIGDQISKRADFYSFLFSLGYIEPHYELRQNGKNLDKLSPGEKGALLLVFYLILDKSEIPLVVDQPEDNLDNHSVAKVLVPFIKMAKKQRQIIMVTHNPNLAVVADAEQIIHVEIDKINGNKFSFISGSIEDSEINTKIVNVLEGTMPAFTTRKCKYHR